MTRDRKIIFAMLEALDEEIFGAVMTTTESVFYGSNESVDRDLRYERTAKRLRDIVPKTMRDEFERAKRKKQADRLRAQADRIEAGK